MSSSTIGAVALIAMGLMEIYLPGWNGFFSDVTNVSEDTKRITSMVCFVGAIVLMFAPRHNDK